MWWQTILAAIGYFTSGAPVTFRLGAYSISAQDAAGAPVHLNWQQFQQAATMVFSGLPGSVQSGDIKITVSKSA